MEETQYTEDSNHDLGHNTCDPETQHDYTREDKSLFISAQIEKQDKVRGHVGRPSIRALRFSPGMFRLSARSVWKFI